MNLTTNNINFNGKAEVLYGLKKAAQEAHNIEVKKTIARGPRPVNITDDLIKGNASMNAYLDMTVNDDSFVKTLSSLAQCKESSYGINKFLKEETLPNGKIKPLDTFAKALLKSVSDQKIAIKENVVKRFIEILG